jgi:DNA-binding NarL/FixJ family response regulator
MEEQAETIGIFLVDTNVLFRHGVKLALAKYKDIDVLGEADITTGTIQVIEEFSPKVVLVDVNLPQFNGLDLTRQITQHCPQMSVIVLSPYEDENQLFQAIRSGAVAYLSKNVSADELASVIRRVAQGEHVITESLLAKPRVAESVLKQFQDLSLAGIAMESLAAPITPRELEIISYVARGYGNKRIAYTMNISEQTIKNRITSILRKLDANDRTHAVVLAMRHGWISMTGKVEVPLKQ